MQKHEPDPAIWRTAFFMAIAFAACPLEVCMGGLDCQECKADYWIAAAEQVHAEGER